MQKLPVVVAIPAYNAELTLPKLLDQVLEQEYDGVFVMDDASTDNSYELAHSYEPDITVIRGHENVGAAGNRNRVIDHLGSKGLTQFFDADVSLNSDDAPEKARQVASAPDIGFVGGLIRNPDSTQNPWNFGPGISAAQILSSWIYSAIYEQGRKNPERAGRMRKIANYWSLIQAWPDTLELPVATDTYYASEANLIFPNAVLKQTGGFDPSLRYHEIMELSVRTHKLGLRSLFNPAIDVTHETWDHTSKKRNGVVVKAQLQVIGKVGIRQFLLPPKSSRS